MKLIEESTCPKCGGSFNCSKSGKCWCFEISVPTSIAEAINKKYDSCLCPSCLKLLASNPKLEV